MSKILKDGQMIAFASEEYSDYRVDALVSVVKDFDIKEKQEKWESENVMDGLTSLRREGSRVSKVKGVGFMSWLVSHGLVKEVDYLEVHIGSCGTSEVTYNDDDDYQF